MNKALKITGIVLSSILLLLLVAVLGFKAVDYVRHTEFYATAKKEFPIAGLSEGYIPQGFDYYADGDIFLASGYMADKSATRVYTVGRDGSASYTKLLKKNGDPYTSHAGGVTAEGDYLYVAGTRRIDVFPLADILDPYVTEARLLGSLEIRTPYGISASFCTVRRSGDSASLVLGCFHDAENGYETDEKIHITTPSGDKNHAVLLSFPLSADAELGIVDTPEAVYSIPSYVQGIAFTNDGGLLLSTSYGLSTSHIYLHDLNAAEAAPNMSYAEAAFGNAMPLYYIDGSTLKTDLTAPPMAEEIAYLNGRVYIMNESAAHKYYFGMITSGNDLYSLPIE